MKIRYFLAVFGLIIFSFSLNAQWVRINGPIGGFYSLAASDTCIFAGNNNGRIYRSTDNGATWNVVYYGSTGSRTDEIAASGTNIFAANDAGVVRSTNNGTNWTMVGLTGNLGPQALAISDTNIFAGTSHNGVYRSTNNGANWSAVNSGLTDTAQFITALFALDTTLFAGTWGRGAFRSTNNGALWIPVDSSLTSTHVHAFTVAGANLFAGTFFSDGVYLSTDYGGTWTAVNNGLTNKNVRALAISDTNIFAGTFEGGLFHSTINGAVWSAFNEGFTINTVNKLLEYNSYLYAGTENGIWRRPLSDITDVEYESKHNLSGFILEHNYPNPFNPSTRIRYQVSGISHVSLIVYDILGNEVETLVNEEKPAGTYEVEFFVKGGSASGVYFYQLKAGSFIETKKMILLR